MRTLLFHRRRPTPTTVPRAAAFAAGIAALLLAGCGGGGGGGDPGGSDNGQTPGAAVAWRQDARIRANIPYYGDYYGSQVRLASDGGTLAVAASDDKSDATEINGDETDRRAATVIGAGAIHVYVRGADGRLTRQAYLKPPGGNGVLGGNSARLGTDFVMSPDGNRIVAGAPDAKGVDNDFGSLGGTDYGFGAGRIAVFDRDAGGAWRRTSWTAVADGRRSDRLGSAVAMSADGRWVVAGAWGRVHGDVNTGEDYANGLFRSGAAYLFRLQPDGQMQQVARLRAPYPQQGAWYGGSVAMSGDGEWIAIGAWGESTLANGQPVAEPLQHQSFESGSVHLYRRSGDGPPVFVRTLKSPALQNLQNFGRAIAFSRDGSRLAVGADLGSLVETGTTANIPASLYKPGPGDVYVFRRDGADFTLEASLTPRRESAYDRRFGFSVALDDGGERLAVGMLKDNHALGAANAGYVWSSGSIRVYRRNGQAWSLVSTMRSDPARESAEFGASVAFSGDGRWLMAGAWQESGPGAGVDPPNEGEGKPGGAAYLFRSMR